MSVDLCCVDWGTSSFRLWAMTREGVVVAERRSASGMSTLTSADYSDILEHMLAEVGANNATPVVICGMAGAAQGWREVAYIDLPAELAAVPHHSAIAPSACREVRILPGLARRDVDCPDVIRGEETQLLGAVLEQAIEGTVCLPGTHSKWATVQNGAVTAFSTVMTGEVFALLAEQSTLSHFLTRSPDAIADAPAFSRAVQTALDAPESVLGRLFSVRAAPLLLGSAGADMRARLSGFLIGLEIAGMKRSYADQIVLISNGVLAENYRRAFEIAGIAHECLDAEEMVRAGLYRAAKILWPNL